MASSNVVEFPKPNKRPPYIKAGDVITCENGHKIAVFLVDVYKGDMQDPDKHIGGWTQDPPMVGAPASTCVCVQCGASFYTGGGHFFIKGEWT